MRNFQTRILLVIRRGLEDNIKVLLKFKEEYYKLKMITNDLSNKIEEQDIKLINYEKEILIEKGSSSSTDKERKNHKSVPYF